MPLRLVGALARSAHAARSNTTLKLGAFFVLLAVPGAAQPQSVHDTVEYIVQQCVGVPFALTRDTRSYDPHTFTMIAENFGNLEAARSDNVTYNVPLNEVQFSVVERYQTFNASESRRESYDTDVLKISCSDGSACINVVDRYDGRDETSNRTQVAIGCRQPDRAANALEHLKSIAEDPFS